MGTLRDANVFFGAANGKLERASYCE